MFEQVIRGLFSLLDIVLSKLLSLEAVNVIKRESWQDKIIPIETKDFKKVVRELFFPLNELFMHFLIANRDPSKAK